MGSHHFLLKEIFVVLSEKDGPKFDSVRRAYSFGTLKALKLGEILGHSLVGNRWIFKKVKTYPPIFPIEVVLTRNWYRIWNKKEQKK